MEYEKERKEENLSENCGGPEKNARYVWKASKIWKEINEFKERREIWGTNKRGKVGMRTTRMTHLYTLFLVSPSLLPIFPQRKRKKKSWASKIQSKRDQQDNPKRKRNIWKCEEFRMFEVERFCWFSDKLRGKEESSNVGDYVMLWWF